MKITNIEAFQSVQTLSALKERGKLGYAIARNMRKLEEELTEYTERRNELIKAYGSPTGDGEYQIPAANMGAFFKEMDEYNEIEFEFQPHTVTEDVFCSGSLTSDQMYILDWMVGK